MPQQQPGGNEQRPPDEDAGQQPVATWAYPAEPDDPRLERDDGDAAQRGEEQGEPGPR